MSQYAPSNDVLVVRSLEDQDAAAWSAFVTKHPNANLYHTLPWRDAIQEIFGHRPHYLICSCGTATRGVLPLFLVKLPIMGSKLISIPYDIGSGGALAVDEKSEYALAEKAVALAKRLGVGYLELRRGSPSDALSTLGLQSSEPVQISEMRLDTEEEVWSRVSKDHRKAIRKAQNRGVEIRDAESLADVNDFYQVYLKVFKQFGTPPYGANYFPSIWRRFHDSGALRVLLAHVDRRCVGGLVMFNWNKNIVSKFSACLPDAVPKRAYAALYWRAIQIGLQLGARTLNWGTSSLKQTGLIEFKERWGAHTRPAILYSLAVRRSVPSIEAYYDSEGLVRRAWGKLPLSATRVIGGVLNRWYC